MFSQLVSLALLLPSLTLVLASRAEAQAVQNPAYAVVQFKNLKAPGTTFGREAARAVSVELSQTGRYEVIPEESLNRAAETLGIAGVPETDTDLLRLAQESRAQSVVSGEIVDYVIRNMGSGRQAVVALRVIVTDVSSGLRVNGAAIVQPSVTRAGNVEENVLINDAFAAAAREAVRRIEQQTLPNATVLNTTERTALINQGERSGFREGQTLIVSRGRIQVATARVTDSEPDQSWIRVERFIQGIQPGDRVRPIFEVPPLPRLTAEGKQTRSSGRRVGNASTIITVALVLLVGILLLSGGNGSDQRAADRVVAEALDPLDPAALGQPAVRISWSPNGFSKSNSELALWQVYRNGQGAITDVPVATVDGTQTSVVDTPQARGPIAYANFGGQIGLPNGDADNCFTAPTDATIASQPGITPGLPLRYDVQVVYRISNFSIPSGGGGDGGGTAGGSTRQAGSCYFLSARTQGKGTATPLRAAGLVFPAREGTTVSGPLSFSVSSAVTSTATIQVEYAVQVSDRIDFPRDRTRIIQRFTSGARGTVASPTIDTRASSIPAFIRNSETLYFRIGARNVFDNPGPARDPLTRERYIFSEIGAFRRPINPPNPPGGTPGGGGL